MSLHPTLVWKCINETPEIVKRCVKGEAADKALLVGREMARRGISRAYLFGCGTSHFAAIASAYALNAVAGIDSDYYEAFEFLRYRMGSVNLASAALAFSHSGRTKVTHEAVLMARKRGILSISYTDDPQSPLAQASEYVVEGGAGIEPVGPKTRSFVTTVILGYLTAAAVRNDTRALEEIESVATALGNVLVVEDEIRTLAKRYCTVGKAYVVGGGPNIATAMELALKFKECVPLGAEPLETEDALHGPIGSFDRDTLIITVSTEGESYAKIGDVLKAATAIGCPCVSITNLPYNIPGVETIRVQFSGIREVFTVPLLVFPGYMLVYYSALSRGNNPDNPRKGDPAYAKARNSIARVTY